MPVIKITAPRTRGGIGKPSSIEVINQQSSTPHGYWAPICEAVISAMQRAGEIPIDTKTGERDGPDPGKTQAG